MPHHLKRAIVKPIIKKSTLEPESMKNYRPVSNLAYIGKIIEKVVVNQLDAHLTDNNLHEPLQSAYRTGHSMETALLNFSNDILLALDKRRCVYLVLLDLSAAFDTIDHTVFLSRLEKENGVTADALGWMSSYLSGWQQCISINSTLSDNRDLHFGFPQGSLIGPFSFKLYTKPLTSIAKKHSINIHLYADDMQLYTSFKPEESEAALERLEACIEEIRNWMEANYLKLNDSKTEFVIFGTQIDLAKVSGWTVTVGNSEILPSKSARNTGAFMDLALNMEAHINNIIRSCYAQLHSIPKIRRYLTIDAANTIVHAFVLSRLDNLNSLLYDIPASEKLERLQMVQNNTARLLVKQSRMDHITPTLIKLHWLPVKYRIEYKILLLVYECVTGVAPSYLASLIPPYIPGRSGLRSASSNQRAKQITKKKYGDRAFSHFGPHHWNNINLDPKNSPSIEVFKKDLKTYLFKKAYKKYLN